MMARSMRRRSGPFIATKEHRRFTEFANTIRKHGTIGLCFGPAGVGKTLSARRHANWEIAEPLLHTWGRRDPSDEKVYAAARDHRIKMWGVEKLYWSQARSGCCPWKKLLTASTRT
jgi:hypothetical protein